MSPNSRNPSATEFASTLASIHSAIATVEGQLTRRETACLAWLGAHPTAPGEILEIGSFKGRSTIVLALASRLVGATRIMAVDPLTSPCITDPALGPNETSAAKDFEANLAGTGVRASVEFHQMFSHELAAAWPKGRKIRLLWIDGNHTYEGARQDFDLFRPHLADGAIVAFHDTLHHHGGPARVMAEAVLLSENFGAAGFSGSIGWSQYFANPADAARWTYPKLRLYRQLSRVISYNAFGGDIEGFRKLCYKLSRAMVPHGDMSPTEWHREVVVRG